MNYVDKRILVSGGAGFIGSNLVKKLVDLGAEVIVSDNLSRGSMENLGPILKKIHFNKFDLTQIGNCLAVTKDVDFVFHLAASVGGIQFIQKELGGIHQVKVHMVTSFK